jgi:hypothetical protein
VSAFLDFAKDLTLGHAELVMHDIYLDRMMSLAAKYREQGLSEQDAQDRAEREMVEGGHE